MRPADARLDGPRHRTVLREREVRARAHVVRDVAASTRRSPASFDDDHVIEALASDGADDAFDVGVLPRRARRRADGLDVHAGDGGGDRGEGAIPIVERDSAGAWSSGKAFRSCCAIHGAVGWSVTAVWTMRRRSCPRMTSTNSSRNVTVGTTNRSAATIWLAWVVRKVRQVCDGGRGCRRMYFATVDWLTVMPNFCSSPWMRGAPQSGFAVDSSRIRARTSVSTLGRPVRRRLFQVQKRRKPRRCQAMTVVRSARCAAPTASGPRHARATPRAAGLTASTEARGTRAVHHRHLVSQREDLEMQRRA